MSTADKHQFTITEVEKMYQHEILSHDERIELIDGELYVMSPKNPPHFITQRNLFNFFFKHLAEKDYLVDREIPIDISRNSMPEPDLIIAYQREGLQRDEYVQVPDVVLLVEVSDATLSRDLESKKELYARADIPVYWVINIPQQQVHIFSDLYKGDYGTAVSYKKGPFQALPFDFPITFDDIFPKI
ncbi:Uma2 family endonuclease [Tunicatimonas pelagia]|uniref:Uma2 family endonuclease n=1 Tax=Tunicatimonas pelagia TaxID=931531 RepID=UPI0026664A2E|nr:Uma2 family endonuclease [Tunicatimonas pelagia]WKN40792.1 Uma2 family endonuclease [Tunicatimonas pelagia]